MNSLSCTNHNKQAAQLHLPQLRYHKQSAQLRQLASLCAQVQHFFILVAVCQLSCSVSTHLHIQSACLLARKMPPLAQFVRMLLRISRNLFCDHLAADKLGFLLTGQQAGDT